MKGTLSIYNFTRINHAQNMEFIPDQENELSQLKEGSPECNDAPQLYIPRYKILLRETVAFFFMQFLWWGPCLLSEALRHTIYIDKWEWYVGLVGLLIPTLVHIFILVKCVLKRRYYNSQEDTIKDGIIVLIFLNNILVVLMSIFSESMISCIFLIYC